MWNRSDVSRSAWRAALEVCSEEALADAWQDGRYAGPWLVDCCGRHLRVVFAGRRWGGPGPDFVGAVLALRDGTLVRGDVEVHVRASNWRGHGHTAQRAYEQVVLHVVQRADALVPDAWGGHVPTVELAPTAWAGAGPAHGHHRPAAPCVHDAAAVLGIVAAAGHDRFRGRAARFEGDLEVATADQVVWRAVAEALGYGRNTRPFGLLAEAVPWSEAAQVALARGPLGLAGLLLGTAGLLGQASLPEAHHWRSLQRERSLRAALRADSWARAQLRAANAPAQRCRGLAELGARWAAATGGLAEQVLEAVAVAARVRSPRLWSFALAQPWVGRGRAQVIAVNVLLPFAAAAGGRHEAEALFERLPGEPSNRVLRYMAGQLAADGVRFRGACYQQGLLHLFKQTCASRVCEGCPARDHLAPIDVRA